MDTYYLRSAGLVSFLGFDNNVNDPLTNHLDCPTQELKTQATSIAEYTTHFNWVKNAVMCDKLVFAAIGTDGLFDFITTHRYESGPFDTVSIAIANWKYRMFIYETGAFHVYTRQFLQAHSKTKIRTIYERSILHRYVNHYFKLFEKQHDEGLLISGENYHVVFPNINIKSDTFTEVVNTNA